MKEIEDYDMECEQIYPEELGGNLRGPGEMNHQQEVLEGRPMTPCNDISGVSKQHEELRPETPPNNISPFDDDSFCTPNNHDTSFIKRVGIDKLMMKSRVMPGMTSTPLLERDRLSNTLPSTLNAPNLLHLRNERQCKSAGNVRRPKLGPNGIPFKYINPFTPDGKMLASKLKAQKKFKRLSLDATPPKFCLNDSSESEIDLDDIPRRARLREFNVNRFNEEFIQLQEIGKGDHGCVFKCLNRLNGCFYAIKKTLKPIKTGIQERTVRNEIYAHGVLFHQNIVRNFSCWKEEGFVFIQNEFCNGGNLENYIETNSMSESLLRNLLLQIASALKYMHNVGLAHMDIKPGNIFLCIEHNKESSLESDGGFSDDDKSEEITFKLGDLGHVSRLDEDDAEEGDCRYLSREIIEETYTHLDRADIFALGLTVYEAAGGGPLPKNGDEWHVIRNGNLKYLDSYTKEFNDILKRLIDPSAEKRPSAADLVEMLKPVPPSPLPEDMSTYIQRYRRTNTRLEHTALPPLNLIPEPQPEVGTSSSPQNEASCSMVQIRTSTSFGDKFKQTFYISFVSKIFNSKYLKHIPFVKATNQYLKVLFKSHRQIQEQLHKEKVSTPSKDKLLSLGKKKGAVTKTRVIGRKTKRSSSTTMF